MKLNALSENRRPVKQRRESKSGSIALNLRSFVRMILWASTISIAAANVGCESVRSDAPKLVIPPRPSLDTIPLDKWRQIPSDIRIILETNQLRLMGYMLKLEAILEDYETWRSGEQLPSSSIQPVDRDDSGPNTREFDHGYECWWG